MVGHTHLFVIKIMPFRDEIVDIMEKTAVKGGETSSRDGKILCLIFNKRTMANRVVWRR